MGIKMRNLYTLEGRKVELEGGVNMIAALAN